MTTARPCLASACALVLAVLLAALPAHAEPGPVWFAPPPREKPAPYAHTAIGAVIEANGGRFPATGTELAAALAKVGDFVQLPVSFSAVAPHSGLANPRVVITMRPASIRQAVPTIPSGGWGGGVPLGGVLGQRPTNKPYLEGRLFLAANTEPGADGPVVKTVEFISWNGRAQKFDFGVIEGMGGTPELKMLDGARCLSCHKNKGPILGVTPWSNTAHNEQVRSASAPRFTFGTLLDPTGKEDPALGRRDDIDGLRVLRPNGPEVDAAVRQGADVLRDRERFRLLARTAAGRKGLVLLLGGIATRGELDALDQKLKFDLNQLDLITFLQDVHAANKVLAPSALADFNPAVAAVAGPKPPGPKGQHAPPNVVGVYDALRAAGATALPTQHQPSNPKAFIRPAAFTPTNPSQLVSAVALARTIGLSERDREFVTELAENAAGRLTNPKRSAAAVARAIFNGPHFADVLKTGVLPERDDFKDRFVAGYIDLMRAEFDVTFLQDRQRYTSAPKRDPNAKAEKEAEVLPSHACLRCHDVAKGGKVAFNPIPALAFDPFDATAREAWLKGADRKRKLAVLGRMMKRVGTDKDMPPEDSTEHELYRAKDPAALNDVRAWLEAELKRAK
ncbi:MAG: hypothetical protein FJ304_26970 [Planctomycetes bacterium]|nr:hypothetical protein [Planctomycetota bacterium]